MGQYHRAFSYNETTFRVRMVQPYALARGLKAWEQLGGNVGAALIALLSVDPADRPGDLRKVGGEILGSWAGTRILLCGDYAEKDDIPDWAGPPLKDGLYDLWNFEKHQPAGESERSSSTRGRARWRTLYEDWLAQSRILRRWAPLTDDSNAVAELVEHALGVRFVGDGWKDEVRVRDGSMSKDEIANGQARVIYNLDKQEYIDPRSFRATPTTAGMMRHALFPDALLTALFQAKSRGGGDLPEDRDVPEAIRGWLGRWHGDRLVATAEQSPIGTAYPSTSAAIAAGTNLSKLALSYARFLDEQ